MIAMTVHSSRMTCSAHLADPAQREFVLRGIRTWFGADFVAVALPSAVDAQSGLDLPGSEAVQAGMAALAGLDAPVVERDAD
jgi:hypothetical protein